MKSKTFLSVIFIGLLFVASCKQSSQQTTGANDDSTSVEDTTLFSKLPGNVLNDTTVKYVELSEQAEGGVSILTTALPSNCEALPKTIGKIISGTDFFYHKFDSNTSAGASAFGFSGSIGKKEMLIVQDYVRYQNVKCGGTTKKFGIGLRSFILIKSFRGEFKGTLSQVAASVELGRASATYSLKSLGFAIDGDVISNAMDTQGEYDVESFSKLAVLQSTIMRSLTSKSAIEIDPVYIPD